MLLAFSGVSLAAKELVSTARVSWSVLGREFASSSNTVSIPLVDERVVLRTYRADPAGIALPVTNAICGKVPVGLPSRAGPAVITLSPTDTVFAGDDLVLEIASARLNRDSAVIETVTVSIGVPGADLEHVTLIETATDSGVFRSRIQTQPLGTQFATDDCRLGIASGQVLRVALMDVAGRDVPVGVVDVLVDPFGLVVDSQDGRPVSGTQVALVDDNGQPADVFASDGVTRWPSTMVTGQPVTDGAGNVYPMLPGEYRFPLVRQGSYRLVVQPPAPYSAPSVMPVPHLSGLRRAGNLPLALSDASFGQLFTLAGTEPLRVDIPVDRPAVAAVLTKSASRALAQPGDALVYTVLAANPDRTSEQRDVVIEDRARTGLRLQADSVRIDGVAADPQALSLAADGRGFTLQLGQLPPGANRKITYVMRVREDAAAGFAENIATLRDSRGITSTVSSSVRIEREIIASRMTIIGRVAQGACDQDLRDGVAGVQVMLEDGSFAVTDADGRYHFEGVMPGTHVVQIARHSLPQGAEPVACTKSVRAGGSAISRFVIGQGGGLAVADFVIRPAAATGDGAVSDASPATTNPDTNPDTNPSAAALLPMESVLLWEAGQGTADISNPQIAQIVQSAQSSPPATQTPQARSTPGPLSPAAAPAPSLKADVVSPAPAVAAVSAAPKDADARSRRAAGADVDWMAMGDGPDDFLFPQVDHNPSAPAVRVVIRHRKGHRVQLTIQGKPVSDLAYDGVTASADGRYAISIWRGVPLVDGSNRLTAQISDRNGKMIGTLERNVHYSGPPMRAEVLKDRSQLVADGRTRPVIAIRFTDRTGRPVRNGLSGALSINAPYESAAALEALQLSQLSGAGKVAPRWVVDGEDGVALIELAPTMVSGALRLGFIFADGDVRREQRIDDWVIPGDQPWTLIGLAEAAAGAADITGMMEQLGPDGQDIGKDARIAFYAKGKVLGKFLLTAAYDSAKDRSEQRLLGVIDPNSYYTVFGDGSDRRFDAASRERLYVRIESAGFNALYGDFVTGFDQTDLAAYRRAATGVRAEVRDDKWHMEAFAAKISSNQRRDEIQGSGLTGPYQLSTRAILPNSERIVLEVRDRFRSELIVSRRELTRFVDYDLDLLSATIRFRQPVLSRDADLNPQFIVIDYEVDEGRGEAAVNAGIRADYTALDGKLVAGTTVISDSTNAVRGTLVAVDVRAQIDAKTELRGEVAASEMGQNQGLSWQAEAEHHSGKLDMLAYARSIAPEFGIGQQNLAEKGRRKIGVDARYALSDAASITGSTWLDESLVDASRRHAVQVNGILRTPQNDVRAGVTHFSDRLSDGTQQSSTVLEGAVTRRLLSDRLELELSSSIALGSAESADLPARYRLGGRYALNPTTRLLASYEVADGAGLSARTFSGGVELTPWAGGRIVSSLGQSDISEQGRRMFAAAGLAQSFQVTPEFGIDFSVDGNRLLSAQTILPVNPAQPLASGGQITAGAGLFEDFTAATFGANWRKNRWSATGRGEWRDGELADRMGLTLGVIRQLGEGSVLGSGFTWTQATGDGASNGAGSEILDASIAAAYRPASSEFALLGKLEYRADEVTGAVAGETGPVGRSALTITGDGRARRFIGSFSGNWSPRDSSGASGASELGLFVGMRHSLDVAQGYDLVGTSLVAGLDARYGLGSRFELGVSGTMRANLTDDVRSYAFGPSIGVSPVDGTLFTIGYNVSGFDDPDFADARPSREGLFLIVRAKIDQDSFGFLRRNGQ